MINPLAPIGKKNIYQVNPEYNYVQSNVKPASLNSLVPVNKVNKPDEILRISLSDKTSTEENENSSEETESETTPDLPLGSNYAYGNMGYMSALCNIGSMKQLQYASKY